MSVTSLIAVRAFTPPPLLRPLGVIFVPFFSGEKLLRIQTGMPCLHDRAQRFGMQHLRAEIGEFGGFAIGNFRNCARLGHQPRIGGQHAIHIGPDDDFARVDGRAENRRGVVGAAAAERGQARHPRSRR